MMKAKTIRRMFGRVYSMEGKLLNVGQLRELGWGIQSMFGGIIGFL